MVWSEVGSKVAVAQQHFPISHPGHPSPLPPSLPLPLLCSPIGELVMTMIILEVARNLTSSSGTAVDREDDDVESEMLVS